MRGKFRTGAASLALAGATMLGLLASAPTASAEPVSGGGCRYDSATVAAGVALRPCTYGSIDNKISGTIYVTNPNNVNVYVCAQLLQVNPDNSTKQVGNFGCVRDWSSATNQTFYTPGISVGAGTYVVQTGFWATINGHYGYQGFVQGPRVVMNAN